MAFNSKNLSVLAYANGFTLWNYTGEDNPTTPGYFNVAHHMLRAGDMVMWNSEGSRTCDDGVPVHGGMFIVSISVSKDSSNPLVQIKELVRSV